MSSNITLMLKMVIILVARLVKNSAGWCLVGMHEVLICPTLHILSYEMVIMLVKDADDSNAK